MTRPNFLLAAAELFSPDGGRLGKYRNDPVAFVHDCVRWPPGQAPTPYQDEILAEWPVRKRVAVRGPHGLGKSATASLAVLWFALTRDGADWKIPTTASAWRQLTQYLWPEIHKWSRRLDWDRLGRGEFDERRELLMLQLHLRTGQAFSVASDDPASMEGAHADHIAYVFDEAKAITPDIFDAAEGAFSGSGIQTGEGITSEALALAISTPGEPYGRFYDIHRRAPGTEDWWTRHVTLDEAVAAGRVSRDWAEQRARQWGTSSAVYANRVLGDFASSDEDGVIPLAWVEAANERWRAWNEAGRPGEFTGLGVDPAHGGADDTVIAERFGWVIGGLRRFPLDADTTMTAARAAGILRSHGRGVAVVDATGSPGVFDSLRSEIRLADPGDPLRWCTAVGFVASEKTERRDRSGELLFANKRAAMWWNMRELLDPAEGEPIALPPDDMLTGDLTAPHWRVETGARVRVEKKEEIRKRIGRSPDAGDAVVQAFWDEHIGIAGTGAAALLAMGSRRR